MCDVATQKSFVSPNHLPLQEPLITNNPIQRADSPQQQSSVQASQVQDRLDTAQQAPRLGRVAPQTGVEAAFSNPAGQQIARVAEPGLSRPMTPVRSLEPPTQEVIEAPVEEKPKNFWEKVKDFMAKAFEVISDVVSTVLGWLGKIGQIAGSLAGVVGRFIPGAGEFLGGIAAFGSSVNSSERPAVEEPRPAITPRPTLRS